MGEKQFDSKHKIPKIIYFAYLRNLWNASRL